MAKKGLTPKQNMFVKEYLIDLNATQAAIRAGYSEKTAYSIGVENLSKPVIAEAIQKAMDKRAEKVDITAEKVLESILDIRGKAMAKEDLNAAIRCNEQLGKYLTMFTERTINTNLNAELSEAEAEEILKEYGYIE